jgi:hypothetical protein
MKKSITCLVALLMLVASTAFADTTEVVITIEKKTTVEVPSKPPFAGKRAAVDVAILLDTSNSMDGLINQAKSQLWTIIQQFAKAQKNGQTPLLRVALFEYGNNGLPAAEGFIRQVVPLTDNMDKLSQELFALSTNGGDEYCGQVIQETITRLDWSKEPNAYKAIFIAGNEPFTQGLVDYRESCSKAIQAGIVVNTIHCGNHASGVSGQWQHGAQLAEGEFFNIDQDRAVVHIHCPQDKIILKLNAELNKTYLWYGKKDLRSGYAENQVAQDRNAEAAGEGVAVGRAGVKSGKMYINTFRCIVDTFLLDEAILSKVKEDELPDVLRKMTPEKRMEHVKTMAATRGAVQKKIADQMSEREVYLAEQRKLRAVQEGEATLGDAVVAVIAKQLAKSGFETEAESN